MEDILKTRQFESLIFELRGYKVMIDADLASLYETETKKLKQKVKRMQIPEDFVFELNTEEKDQLVTICDRLIKLKHSSVNPLAFTRQGVAMLSSVLRSPKAVKINIEIMRAFVYYRQILLQNHDLYKKINELDEKINDVFKYLLSKIETKRLETEPVGYKISTKKNN